MKNRSAVYEQKRQTLRARGIFLWVDAKPLARVLESAQAGGLSFSHTARLSGCSATNLWRILRGDHEHVRRSTLVDVVPVLRSELTARIKHYQEALDHLAYLEKEQQL